MLGTFSIVLGSHGRIPVLQSTAALCGALIPDTNRKKYLK